MGQIAPNSQPQVSDPVKLSQWDKLRLRLLALKGQVVNLTIIMDDAGEPELWAVNSAQVEGKNRAKNVS